MLQMQAEVGGNSILHMSQYLKDFVISRNIEQSNDFCEASVRSWRHKYRVAHPTEVAAFKCMDGRLNLALMTETPPGIIQPFRNVGGKFDLGWPFFGELIKEWVQYALSRNRACLIFVTYHFSKGDKHRGCKGHGYDTDAAKKGAEELCRQIELVYGKKMRIVHPIVVGIETDDEALIFHGEDGGLYNVSERLGDSAEAIQSELARLYPTMVMQTLVDLVPFVEGNQQHVRKIHAAQRAPIELDHAEQIVAVGRGFDWLHLPNRALIVGPYDHDWPSAVATAGTIVLDNIKQGRVPAKEGSLLLVSSFARDEQGSFGWNTAIEKARYLERVSLKILHERVPDLVPYLGVLKGVNDAQTRKLHVLD